METLSFVLGIAFVVVIALAIVATYAFVKVIKVKNQLDNIQRQLDSVVGEIYQNIAEENRHCHSRIDSFEKDIYSQLDSRLDKLVSNLRKQKSLI